MRTYVLAILISLAASPAWGDKPVAPAQLEGVTTLQAEEVVSLILNRPELVVIDSRKGDEYGKGHIEGAVNLLDTSMSRERLSAHVPTLNTPILFYCNGVRCLRSSNAALKAQQWGYRDIYWFRGGWTEWRNKQLPVER